MSIPPGRTGTASAAAPYEEIAAAVAADKRVQLEREARWSYLQGAYKDPHAARAALDELVKREGWTSAASRIAREPGQLGELRGSIRPRPACATVPIIPFLTPSARSFFRNR